MTDAQPPVCISNEDVNQIREEMTLTLPPDAAVKPLWVHLQPFTRCNQQCLHCYCWGGPKGLPVQLELKQWFEMIDRLESYGVMDIYVTGGETLSNPAFFEIAEYIVKHGLGFGLSTNATVITEAIVDRLRDLNISRVQVSLDGAFATTYEAIRGAPGNFPRAIQGISLLAKHCKPVINVVACQMNLLELEEIVKLGIRLGTDTFKIFPMKASGRGKENRNLLLDDQCIMNTLLPEVERLRRSYAVSIESLDRSHPCGSGRTGFAVNERGDVWPCIFGIGSTAHACGNLLREDLDDIWYGAPMTRSRSERCDFPCHRCE